MTPSEESYIVQENDDKDSRLDDCYTLSFQSDLCDPILGVMALTFDDNEGGLVVML